MAFNAGYWFDLITSITFVTRPLTCTTHYMLWCRRFSYASQPVTALSTKVLPTTLNSNRHSFQLLKEFSELYGTSITVFTKDRHLFRSRARSIQSTLPHPTSLWPMSILSSHLCLDLSSGLFLLDFPNKTLHELLLCPIHATRPDNLVLLDLTTQVTVDIWYSICESIKVYSTEMDFVQQEHTAGLDLVEHSGGDDVSVTCLGWHECRVIEGKNKLGETDCGGHKHKLITKM